MPTQRSTRERAPARSNGKSAPDSHGDVEVRRGVAELAARLGDRLPEVVAAISASLRDDIPDLSDEAQLPLVDASVEGNVTTALYALGHDTPVECVQAPTAALEQARRIAQQGFRSVFWFAFTDWGSVVLPVWHWPSCSGSTSRRMHES
jgi:hypothetical protein